MDAPNLGAALELENRTQILATETHDYREATDAFVSKRPPAFRGERPVGAADTPAAILRCQSPMKRLPLSYMIARTWSSGSSRRASA